MPFCTLFTLDALLSSHFFLLWDPTHGMMTSTFKTRLPTSVNQSLNNPSQTCPEIGLHGDPKAYQVDKVDIAVFKHLEERSIYLAGIENRLRQTEPRGTWT